MKTARNLCLIIILVTVFSLQAVFAEDGTKLGSNLEDWTYTEDTNSITLSHLKLTSGTSADVVVPGEFAGHEGKQVYLESNKANDGVYNPLWGDGMSPKVTSLIIGDSTHKVKVKDGDATSLFYSLESMKTIDVSALDTSDIVNMKEMFYNNYALKAVDLSTFDTSSVTDMSLQKMLTTGCTQTMRQHQSRYPSQNGRKLA